jgi:uncharacterized protein
MASANEQLGDAAGRGDVAEIERQIAAGADPSARIEEVFGDWTPLRRAAERGHVAAIAALLKAGARMNGADSYGQTPLMRAAFSYQTAAVHALVAAGADVHRAHANGDTALHGALRNGGVDAARVLLEAGARTDVRNKAGERPIDVVRPPLARSLRLHDRIMLLYRCV